MDTSFVPRGFLPEPDPLARFGELEFAPLDELGRDLPSLLLDPGFRSFARRPPHPPAADLRGLVSEAACNEAFEALATFGRCTWGWRSSWSPRWWTRPGARRDDVLKWLGQLIARARARESSWPTDQRT